MTITEKAVEYHAMPGVNCAQSVLRACGEYTGLDEKTAQGVAAAFGSGMRCGEACGAVAGALMAIGASCSTDQNGGPNGAVAPLAKELTAKFKEQYTYIRCPDLIRDAGKKRCDEFIGFCARAAEEIIKEHKG